MTTHTLLSRPHNHEKGTLRWGWQPGPGKLYPRALLAIDCAVGFVTVWLKEGTAANSLGRKAFSPTQCRVSCRLRGMPRRRRPRNRSSASQPFPSRSDSHRGGCGRSRRSGTDLSNADLYNAKKRYKTMHNEFTKLIIKSSEACEVCEHCTTSTGNLCRQFVYQLNDCLVHRHAKTFAYLVSRCRQAPVNTHYGSCRST